ncbi:MAG: thioredoxin family protein [Saprospiraceae bacterium]
MRPLKYVLLLLLFPFFSFGQGIEFFEGTWKEAMAKAKAENKLLFVDSYTTWCGPCIRMAKNVFTLEKVGNFFNQNFINLKLDMEKEDGISFGHKYPVKAYPTLFFLNGDGKVIKKITGGQQPDGLISQGENALKSNDQSGQYVEQYEAGNREYSLVFDYVKALNMAGKPSLKISNDYLSSNPEITEEQKLLFIFEAVVEADSRLFTLLTDEKAKILPLVGQDSYDQKIKKACETTVEKAIQFEVPSLVDEAVQKMKENVPSSSEAFEWKSKYQYSKTFRDEKAFIKAYRGTVKMDSKNEEVLKTVAKDIISSFPENKEMLKDAVTYAEKVYEIKSDQESLNFLCHVLMIVGDIKTAVKHVNEAKENAVKKGEDISYFDNMIRFLENK